MSSSDFLPPDEMTLAGAGDALCRCLAVREGVVRESDRTYFDTFDGLLHADGLSMVHEGGRLILVDQSTGAERAGINTPQPTRPLLAFELEPGTLRDALTEVVDVRALLPLAHVHSRARALDVLNGESKTVVRMTLEEPVLVVDASRHTALRPRIRLAVVRGYDKALARVQRTLQDELGFKPADQPLLDEAVRAAGGIPGGTSSKIDVPLRYDERADEAVVAVLRALLDVIERNLQGTIAALDTEFLHDFRVSVRRSRSVQRQCKHVFSPSELAHFRSEFRWLQRITGDARDLDVYVLEFDQYRAMVHEAIRPDLDPLLEVLRDHRLNARRQMEHALGSERTSRLLSEWVSFLDRLVGMAEDERPAAAGPIGELASKRIRKVYKRMMSMGGAIDAASSSEAYHELRKKGKELRYMLELFGEPLYASEVVKPMIKTLKALQDTLGRHQDREVQVATLSSLRDEVCLLDGGAAALMAMGVLVERLEEDKYAARSEFAERYAAFAAKSQRSLVKDTFA